jgi:predicted adenine nucleotide alpha hydrolase (AANH) superfamily ATPase
MNMLLHICCAPCAIYPLARLRDAGFSVRGYWYNPNIHPYREYEKRMSTVREFSGREALPVSYRDGYDLDEFLVRTAGTGAGRCEQCYRMRLDAAAAETKKSGHNLFTTSLLYSKYQKHDLIRGIAKEMAGEQGVELYYEDFRTGWSVGVKESKAMGLYRQQYCGCVYSEKERNHPGAQASSHADRAR